MHNAFGDIFDGKRIKKKSSFHFHKNNCALFVNCCFFYLLKTLITVSKIF